MILQPGFSVSTGCVSAQPRGRASNLFGLRLVGVPHRSVGGTKDPCVRDAAAACRSHWLEVLQVENSTGPRHSLPSAQGLAAQPPVSSWTESAELPVPPRFLVAYTDMVRRIAKSADGSGCVVRRPALARRRRLTGHERTLCFDIFVLSSLVVGCIVCPLGERRPGPLGSMAPLLADKIKTHADA